MKLFNHHFRFLCVLCMGLFLSSCTMPVHDFPNLSEVGERPSPPSHEQVRQTKERLLDERAILRP